MCVKYTYSFYHGYEYLCLTFDHIVNYYKHSSYALIVNLYSMYSQAGSHTIKPTCHYVSKYLVIAVLSVVEYNLWGMH